MSKMEIKRYNVKFGNGKRLDRTMLAQNKEEVFKYMSEKYKRTDLTIKPILKCQYCKKDLREDEEHGIIRDGDLRTEKITYMCISCKKTTTGEEEDY